MAKEIGSTNESQRRAHLGLKTKGGGGLLQVLLRTLRVAPPPPHFSDWIFGLDFDVSSRLEVSRLDIIDADTQDVFVWPAANDP